MHLITMLSSSSSSSLVIMCLTCCLRDDDITAELEQLSLDAHAPVTSQLQEEPKTIAIGKVDLHMKCIVHDCYVNVCFYYEGKCKGRQK